MTCLSHCINLFTVYSFTVFFCMLWCNTGVIDIYELKATYLLTYFKVTYQVLVPDGGTEPDVKTQNSDPPWWYLTNTALLLAAGMLQVSALKSVLCDIWELGRRSLCFYTKADSKTIATSVQILRQIDCNWFVTMPSPRANKKLSWCWKSCATRYHPEGGKVSATGRPPYRRIVCEGSKTITYRQAARSYSTAIAQRYQIEIF